MKSENTSAFQLDEPTLWYQKNLNVRLHLKSVQQGTLCEAPRLNLHTENYIEEFRGGGGWGGVCIIVSMSDF